MATREAPLSAAAATSEATVERVVVAAAAADGQSSATAASMTIDKLTAAAAVVVSPRRHAAPLTADVAVWTTDRIVDVVDDKGQHSIFDISSRFPVLSPAELTAQRAATAADAEAAAAAERAEHAAFGVAPTTSPTKARGGPGRRRRGSSSSGHAAAARKRKRAAMEAAAAIAAAESNTGADGARSGADTGGDGSGVHVSGPPPKPVVTIVPTLPSQVRRRFPMPTGDYSSFVDQQQQQKTDAGSRIEYDMDEEDSSWLELVNEAIAVAGNTAPAATTTTTTTTTTITITPKQKKQQQLAVVVTQTMFETIMDRLEKESYFTTSKSSGASGSTTSARGGGRGAAPAPVADVLPYDDDAVCAVCGSGDCENTNAIIFCDSCNLAVHQECYGVPFIPEGQWLCRRCLHAPSKNVRCVFCPNRGGAFKQTDDGRWAHSVCAAWIPEVQLANEVFKEPVTGVADVPKKRWKLRCYLCNKVGACVQCYRANCYRAYHVTCALRAQLFLGLHSRRPGAPLERMSFCDVHTPAHAERKPLVTRHARDGDRADIVTVHTTIAQQEAETPIISVPFISAAKVTAITQAAGIEDAAVAKAFAARVRAYWTLKRRSRHGVPLLRRLQVSHSNSTAEAEHESRLKFYHLRRELEKARMLAGQVVRRERLKRDLIAAQAGVFHARATPLQGLLEDALEALSRRDREGVFAEPVDLRLFPGYARKAVRLVDFGSMRERIRSHGYVRFADFVADFHVCCINSLRFNSPGSWWHSYACKMLDGGNAILEAVAQRVVSAGICAQTGALLDHPVPMTEVELATHGLDVVYGLTLPGQGQGQEEEHNVAGGCEGNAGDGGVVGQQQQQQQRLLPFNAVDSNGFDTAGVPVAAANDDGVYGWDGGSGSGGGGGASATVAPVAIVCGGLGAVLPPHPEETALLGRMVSARALSNARDRLSAMTRLGQELGEVRARLGLPDIRPPPPSAAAERKAAAAAAAAARRPEPPARTSYQHWDLVWAKDRGWPWFPAEVVDPEVSPDGVPDEFHMPGEQVLSMRPEEEDPRDPAYLVLFFDTRRSWTWLRAHQLRVLFADDAADAAKAAEPSKASLKKQVKAAYKMAADYVKATRSFRKKISKMSRK